MLPLQDFHRMHIACVARRQPLVFQEVLYITYRTPHDALEPRPPPPLGRGLGDGWGNDWTAVRHSFALFYHAILIV